MKLKECLLVVFSFLAILLCLLNIKLVHNVEKEELSLKIEYQEEAFNGKYLELLVDYEKKIVENNNLSVLLYMQERSNGRVPLYELEDIYNHAYISAEKYGLNGSLVLAVFGKESNYIKEAVSSPSKGRYDRGLGQVSPQTLEFYNCKNNTNFKEEDLYSIEVASEVSAWYLANLSSRPFIHDDLGILTSYNRGPGNYKKDLTFNSYAEDVCKIQFEIENLIAKL